MTIITPIAGGEAFDPLEDLLNARIAQAEAEFERLQARQSKIIGGTGTNTTNSNFGSRIVELTRIGNVVHATIVVTVATANYLRNAAERSFATIPVGFRPIDAYDIMETAPVKRTANDDAVLTTSLVNPARATLALQGFSASTHDPGAQVRIATSWLTVDEHPAD